MDQGQADGIMKGFIHRTEYKHIKTSRTVGKKQHYTVWLAKTDELVASGTAKECTEQLGLANENVFFSTVMKVRNGKNHKYAIVQEDY